MCGIFALISSLSKNTDVIENVKMALNHRGPDCFGHSNLMNSTNTKTIQLAHTRLKINGDNTPQPLVSKDSKLVLIINGEIFNWKELEQELDYSCTMSDCEIIFPLYEKYQNNLITFFNKLEGQFSFVLYDRDTDNILVGRDRIGITPLYYAYDQNSIVFSSELKAISASLGLGLTIDNVFIFPPRHYMHFSVNESKILKLQEIQYYDLSKFEKVPLSIQDYDSVKNNIRVALKKAVSQQVRDLITPSAPFKFGVLLSGGLDSSLIASLVCKEILDYGMKPSDIKTFSIGVHSQTPDLIAARKVAKYLGTDHSEFYFTIDEGIGSLMEVIESIESFDCTTVRASTPMYLLVKKIKETFPFIKVLFSGELSDELFCYLYGAHAPSEQDYQKEVVRLVENVHKFDCLRANKTCMAHSVEVRVPFTDTSVVETCLSIHPYWKMFGENRQTIEKKPLRDAFVGYLPNEILYRKKEQFSDGVSGFNGPSDNWIDALKSYAQNLYPLIEPADKAEKVLYENIYSQLYGTLGVNTIEIWEPRWTTTLDPSGRIQTFWNKN